MNWTNVLDVVVALALYNMLEALINASINRWKKNEKTKQDNYNDCKS